MNGEKTKKKKTSGKKKPKYENPLASYESEAIAHATPNENNQE